MTSHATAECASSLDVPSVRHAPPALGRARGGRRFDLGGGSTSSPFVVRRGGRISHPDAACAVVSSRLVVASSL